MKIKSMFNLLVVCLLVMASLLGAVPVRPGLTEADAVKTTPAGPPVILRLGKPVNFHRTPPPARALATQRVQTANITIVYLPAGAKDFYNTDGLTCALWIATIR